MTKVFHELLDATASAFAGNEALRFRGRSYSYAELQRRSKTLAAALYSTGVRRGDRVAIFLQNRPEVVETSLACSRLGAIFVPANSMLKIRQLEHVIRDAGAKLLVTSQSVAVSVEDLLERCESLEALVLCDVADSARPAASMKARWDYEELVGSKASRYPAVPARVTVIEDDPAALLYTSGSTGRAKGVVVSHRNLVSGARIVAEYLNNTPGDRILAALPLSFDYGFSQVTTAFAVGACAVLTHFSLPAALVQEVAAHEITGLAGVPTMWMHLSAIEWPAVAHHRLRYITNSGGALPTAVLRQLSARFPDLQIYCMYGLTEAFRSTYLEPADLADRAGSIGKAIPGQEVRVVRGDGSECEPNEIGELVHRGSLVTLGYWNDPELTAMRFRPLPVSSDPVPLSSMAVWSGDLARRDPDGYLYFVGREDHLIKSSGYRISPSEIEEAVLEVEGVVEAAAIGVKDELLGQRIAVAVVGAAGAFDLEEAVRQHCRMWLPAYMVPAEIRLLPALPRNVNGKCDTSSLAAILAGLTSEAGSTGKN